MSMRAKFLLGMFLTISLLPLEARAHFCDDLWAGSYDIVVKPDSDTVTLSTSGTATMSISVQNNMGFALTNFVLTAKNGSTAVTATRQAGKIAGNTLHPGEKARYTLALTGTGGGSVAIDNISFLVSFGNSGENKCYPTKGASAVMVRKQAGTLVPSGTPGGLATAADPGGGCTGEMDQSRQLQYAPQADYISVDTGLNALMTYYCAGRGSWDSGSDANTNNSSACPSGGTVDCTKATQKTSAGAGTKYEYPRLWASLELAVRKSSLGATRLANLRLALQCGAGDANTGFAGFAMMMLGYLGDDPGARTFLTGKAGGTGDLATIAKAALLLFGTAADKTAYQAAVTAGLTGDVFVASACAAALGIVALDDAHVTSVLVPNAKWAEPDGGDNGQSFYSAYLLSLVAWDRRVWAPGAADTGSVSFYETGTPTSTGGSSGTGGSTGSGGSTASGGATGTGGITVTGGKTVAASGGSAGTPNGGATGTGGIIVTGGKTGTATGGGVGTPSGGATGTGGITGGKTATASGGNTGTPNGGSIATGGSTGTLTGGTTGAGTGGNTGSGTGGSTGSGTGGSASGGKEAGTGGNTGAGAGGQNGSGGSSGSVSANSGSAGGCGYAGRAPISLGFLLAGVGLVLALRRRRR